MSAKGYGNPLPCLPHVVCVLVSVELDIVSSEDNGVIVGVFALTGYWCGGERCTT